MALESDPPRPMVVILWCASTPWNPAIIGIPPSLRYLIILLLLIPLIREFLCEPSVKIGICQANQDLDLIPLCISLPAIKAQATCSPDAVSYTHLTLPTILLV